MCVEETEFWLRSLLQNYVPWITYIFLPYHTVLLLCLRNSPYSIWCRHLNLQHRSDMHCTCALGNKNFHSGHYCRITSTVITYIFCQYHIVVLFMSPQLLLQYLLQGFKTCYTVQTCTGHVHEGSEIWLRSLLQNYVPLNDIHIHFLLLL